MTIENIKVLKCDMIHGFNSGCEIESDTMTSHCTETIFIEDGNVYYHTSTYNEDVSTLVNSGKIASCTEFLKMALADIISVVNSIAFYAYQI